MTPKTTRFFFSSSPLSSPPSIFPQTPTFHGEPDCLAQSSLRQPVLAFSSSPLSSPPPVLFDPFEERSSSASRQTSSVASSAASSETDETPPSSQFSKSTLPNIKGRDLFDASIWADPLRTSVFYTFATTLRQKVKDVEPTESHHFIGHLRNRGKLVRCYTQNIDQIEEKVGLSTALQEGPGHRGRFSRKSVGAVLATTASANASVGSETASAAPELEGKREPDEPEGGCSAEGTESGDFTSSAESQSQRSDRKSNGVECVFLHGSLESLRCFLCGKICAWDEGGRAYETLSGRQPECPYCAGATAARQERGKRALGVGKLRPDIVLYGEEHPNAHLISPIVTHDLGLSPDLLLILGTSLKVHGLKVLVREFAKTIHSRGGKVVFVNYTKPPESSWGDIIDYWVQWDCDAWVSNLKERIPLLWLPPGTKLPRKKKESSDKPKKRQGIGEEGFKPKSEPSKSSENAPKISQLEAAVKSEKSPSTATPEAATRTPLPQTIPNSDKADEPVKNEQVRRKSAKQRCQVPKAAVPKAAPRRPMAVRDDTTNAVYVMLKVMAELRRITGNNSMPQSPSPVSLRVEKPNPRRTRKSAPAALPQSSEPNTTHDGAYFKPRPSTSPVKREVQQPETVHTTSDVAGDVTMSGTENSILAAVKLNPRTRKRKTIDGEEVFVPGMSRPALATKALPRPAPQKTKTSSGKKRAAVVSPVSPKILLDIRQAPMDSLTLPPLRTNEKPAATPVKLQPLEPVHSPAGPLSVMSPNSRARPGPKMADPFFYSDSLVHQLNQAPDWTRLRNFQFESPASKKQSRKEADAAMALQGLKKA
ncbi:hst3 protein [Colletotrichum tofieldiae]|nr:hst3 protein [Colletotrichum tofieldiae]GKT78620.1 hst3 protein [Colletotrichum tofieldiae]